MDISTHVDPAAFEQAKADTIRNYRQMWETTLLPALCFRLIEAGIPLEQVQALRPHLDFSATLANAALAGMAGGLRVAQVMMAQMVAQAEACEDEELRGFGQAAYAPLGDFFKQMADQLGGSADIGLERAPVRPQGHSCTHTQRKAPASPCEEAGAC